MSKWSAQVIAILEKLVDDLLCPGPAPWHVGQPDNGAGTLMRSILDL
jgi:hypothetical protein